MNTRIGAANLVWIGFGLTLVLASCVIGAACEIAGHLHRWVYADGFAVGLAAVVVGFWNGISTKQRGRLLR